MVPWKDFIDKDGYSETGIYEGGFVHSTGVWRSGEDSFMRGNPVYNNTGWQRYLIYKRIHDLAELPRSLDDFFEYDTVNLGIDWAVELGDLLP
jgi:hypothetical protein